MATLIAISDGLSAERASLPLTVGASLAAELMRLYPERIDGPWALYEHEVCAENQLSADDMADHVVRSGDHFVLVRRPGTGTEAFFINLVFTLILSAASKMLTPRPKFFRTSASQDRESGTNAVAGQTNVLRPGARVPDILGKLRVFPDLLTQQVEVWDRTLQTITQWFVVGVGDYDLTEYRLGDTLIDNISSTAKEPFPPGRLVDPIICVKYSSTVNSISLTSENTIPSVGGVSFQGTAKTMTSPSAMAVNIGEPITIAGTLNAGMHFVLDLSGAQPPFVYQLNGPVVNESSTTPGIAAWVLNLQQGYSQVDVSGDDITFTTYFTNAYAVGDAIHLVYGGVHYYGTIRELTDLGSGMSGQTVRLDFNDMNGVPMVLGTATNQSVFLSNWHPPPPPSSGSPAGESTLPTDWQAAPMQDPDQLWIDISFPRGLALYHNSTRQPYDVDVLCEFRRGTNDSVIVPIHFVHSDSTSAPLRWTHPVLMSSLSALPAGGDPIQVRLTRVTPVKADTSTDQYLGETRWECFRAVKILPQRYYPDVYLIRLTMSNSRSVAAAEMSFNTVATRKLPTWTGSAWSAAAATEKWADGFISRCKAPDGASLSDAQIDIAGIYALQAQLDAMDGGDQGKIGLALDQLQDIDTELAQIADVVRAQPYRVGQKLFVTRDQSTVTRIALFNGRAKSADAETVAMRFKSGDDNDAVVVTWMDAASGWKQREYQYPAIAQPRNVLRIGTHCANWAQAYRRAIYEWNKLQYRRESITVSVTEDGRICRPGDVVNITDDVANLAAAAGEVIYISGSVLTLDHQVEFGTTNMLLLRDTRGQLIDSIPVTAVAGSPNKVQLTRAPVAGVTIKGRDEAMGTLYAFYNDTRQIVRQWILSAVELNGPWIQLTGVNYSDSVYAGDTGALGTP